MSFVFKVENGLLCKFDSSTGQTVEDWSPMGTGIVGVVPIGGIVMVREDPRNYPPNRSNIYALDENLTLLWTAQQEKPDDFYASLIIKEGRVYAVTCSGITCQLNRTTGMIIETGINRPPVPALTGFYESLTPWKNFFNLAGVSILYCLSALLVLYGVAQVMGSVLAANNGLRECLPYIGVLNLYELSLLGVLILIVVWFNVTDDAISLVILAALFLIGNGIALDTMAPRGPKIVLLLGVGCFTLAMIKLIILKRCILFRLGTISLIALGIILLWNFIGGPIYSLKTMHLPAEIGLRREPWLWLWLVVLIPAVLVLIETAFRPAWQIQEKDREPFLRTSIMGQIFMFLVLMGAGMHQYTNAYLFIQKYTFGDFIPLIGIGSLLAVEILRTSGKTFGLTEVFIACVPLGVTVFGIVGGAITAPPKLGLLLLWYPPVMLGLTGATIFWLSVRNRRPWLWFVVGAYAIGITLTAGFSPDRPYDINWHLSGIFVILMLLGLGIWFKNGNVCLAGALMAAIGFGTTKTFAVYMRAIDVEVMSGVLGLAGLVTLLVYLFFPRQLEKWIVVVGAAAGMIFLFDFAPEKTGWQDLLTVIGVVGLGVAIRLRAGVLALIIPLAFPPLWRLGVFAWTMSAWGYIVLSFLVLVAGAWVSIQKGRKRRTRSLISEQVPKNADGIY